MPDTSPRVAAIILNYNGIDDTRNALRCVRDIDCVAVRPIVIDNGSNNDEGGRLLAEFPDVTVERLPVNVGFARGVNHAARVAIRNGATHLLLMNSDARMDDGNAVLSALLEALFADRGVAAVGPLIVDDTAGTPLQSAGYRYSFWWPVPRANRSIQNRDRCFFASGSFLLIDAKRFAELGGLDPDFFLYGEDLDFAFRCRLAGYRVLVVPSVAVRHRRGASSKVLSNQYVYTAVRGNLINIRKHARWFQLPSCALASLAISIALIGLAARSGNPRSIQAVFAAFGDFFKRRWGGLRDGYALSRAVRPAMSDFPAADGLIIDWGQRVTVITKPSPSRSPESESGVNAM
jgi:GT2 family glycosyltransferase